MPSDAVISDRCARRQTAGRRNVETRDAQSCHVIKPIVFTLVGQSLLVVTTS